MHSRNFYFQSVQHPQLSEGVRGGKELQQVLSRVFQKTLFFKKIKSGTHQTAQTFTFFFMFEISILWRESITDPKVFTFIFSGKVLFLFGRKQNYSNNSTASNMISFLICSSASALLSCKRYLFLIYLMQSLSDFIYYHFQRGAVPVLGSRTVQSTSI